MWIELIMYFIVVDEMLYRMIVSKCSNLKTIYNNKILIALKVPNLFVIMIYSMYGIVVTYSGHMYSMIVLVESNASFFHEIETIHNNNNNKKWIILKLKPFLALRFHSIKKTAKWKQRRSDGLITTQPETFRKKIIIKKMMENGAHEIVTASAAATIGRVL